MMDFICGTLTVFFHVKYVEYYQYCACNCGSGSFPRLGRLSMAAGHALMSLYMLCALSPLYSSPSCSLLHVIRIFRVFPAPNKAIRCLDFILQFGRSDGCRWINSPTDVIPKFRSVVFPINFVFILISFNFNFEVLSMQCDAK